MKYTAEELILIWLDSFLGLEYKHKSELLNYVKGSQSILEFIRKSKDYIFNSIGEKEFNTINTSATKEYFDFLMQGLTDRDIKVITVFSKDYPEEFKSLEKPPLVLYCKGNIDILKSEKFTVVGTRKCLPLTVKITENFVTELVNANFTIVTGIAEGVDITALKTTLKCSGKVISIIASGFDNVHPVEHRKYLEEVMTTGLVMTEYPPQVVALPFMFPFRNRLMGALGKGTLVTGAGIESGALYTAQDAGIIGRDIFTIPYSLDVKSGEGCNDLIKKGAFLCTSPKDILDFYGIKIEDDSKKFDNLSKKEQKIIKALEEINHVEKIAEKLNMQIFEVSSTLALLEIKGVVVKTGINTYSVIK